MDQYHSNTVKIQLPYPPSINKYYFKGRILRPEGREFKTQAKNIITQSNYNPFITEPLLVIFTAHRNDNRIKYDLDNLQKCTLDSLSFDKKNPNLPYLWTDDSQIKTLICVKGEKKADKCVTVEIIPMDDLKSLNIMSAIQTNGVANNKK